MEAAIDILRNEQGGRAVTKDFEEKFCKIIVGHLIIFVGFIFFYLRS